MWREECRKRLWRTTENSRRAATAAMAKQQSGTPDIPDAGNSYDRMKRLSADEEFSALLYAVQQYLGKTFSAIECEKFAYFYDVLHMSCELLEYLAEYCAEGGHTSIRYIEKVALNWYQAGIHTRDEAREHSTRYSKDTSAVMKAFGIMGRNAGTAEQEFMAPLVQGVRLRRCDRHGGWQQDAHSHGSGELPICRQDPHRLEGKRRAGPYRTLRP